MNLLFKKAKHILFSFVALILINVTTSKEGYTQVCSTPGIDGPTVSTPPINTYYPPSGNVVLSSGSTSVLLGAVPGVDPFGNSYGNIEIRPGDLLLIIQIQGASINTSNNTNYGSGSTGSGPDGLGGTGYSNINNVGYYEYIVAANTVPLSGGELQFRGAGLGNGLEQEYTNTDATSSSGQKRFQVVRVPQFSTLSLNSDVSCPAWNGRVGGIIALDAAGAIHMNGYTINASGAGFRAGYQDRENSGQNTSTYRTTSITTASGKGEGIAGTPRWMFDGQNEVDQGSTWIGYPQGDYGRGAPGNAGGGGNDHNAGGGGGSNAGAGGVGGNGWLGAGGVSIPHGGRPGINLPQSLNRIFLGGGGGGGDANNALSGVKGGPGGGAIFITADLITGNGTFIANGDNGQVGAYGSAPDGAGGGGAGGSVFIKTKSPSPTANLSIIANGGNGGNTLNDSGSSHTEHGPGGGGGGGTIFYSIPSASISTQVNAGSNGLTNGGAGNAHGAKAGQNGYVSSFSISDLPNYLEGFSALCIPELIVEVVHTGTNPVSGGTNTTYQITIENISGGASGGTLIESQLPAGFSLVSASVLYSGNATGPSSLTNIGTANQPTFDAFNIPQNGIVTIEILVAVDASVPTGTYHTGSQAHFLDPTRDSSDPARFITAQSNALPGSNTTYQSSGLPVDGSNYDGSPSGPVADNVIIHAHIIANDDDNIGNPVNGFFGGVAIANILENDDFLGVQATIADVDISVLNPSSNTNILLNTTTGEVTVNPLTPGGTYIIEYSICEIGNTGNCDQAIITVEVLHTANVSIEKTANLSEVIAGENVVFTLSVSNSGPSDAQNVLVTDNLPAGLTFVSASSSSGSFIAPEWTLGTLAAGTSESLEITALVNANIPTDSQIENTAIVLSPTPDPDPDDNTSTTTTNIITSADLATTKTATPNPFVAGESITYTITVNNNGPSDAQNVSLADNLPAELELISTSATDGTWNAPDWTIGTLAAGSSRTLTIEARVISNVTQSSAVENTATTTSTTPDPNTANNTATHTGSVNSFADLNVNKTALTVALAGDTIVYNIMVENSGPSYAQNVELNDIVPTSILTPEFSTDGGNNWNSWPLTYTYGELADGDNFSIMLRGVLNANVTEGSIISNTATAEGSTTDPNPSNNNDTETLTVTTLSDLSVEKTGPETIIAGTKITYGLTVLNNGPSNAANLEIEDILPAGISNGEYSLNNGNSWQPWSGLRTLPVFSATPGVNNILIRGDVSPSATGALLNLATASSDTPDPDLSNNASDVTTTIETSANLVLTKTALTSPVNKNEEIIYQISVFNDGPSNATNTIITDAIDPLIISNTEYSTNGGLTWSNWTSNINVGTIANNEGYNLQIRGTVTNNATDPLVNTASVTSDVPDPNLDNNTQTIETPLEVEADLQIMKTAPASITAGTKITYTIEVTNLSPNMNANSVVITDNIDENIIGTPEYSLDSGSSWTPWINWINIGTLNYGDTYTFQIRGDVLSNVKQNIVNTATVNSSTPDPVNSNNSSTTVSTTNTIADIEVIKELITDEEDFVAGAEIVYRLTYINNGPSDATNYMIYDNVPAMITNIEASRCESGFIAWNGSANMGTVVAGGVCTVLIKGTISSNFDGSIINTASVSSEIDDPNLSNNTSTTTNNVNTYADLRITKTSLQENAVAGEVINYTITVNNLGLSDAQNIVVTENLPAELELISVNTSAGTWNSPEWNIGTLADGATVTMEIAALVETDVLQGTTITNTASVTSTTPDPNTSNNTANKSNQVNAVADLEITKISQTNTVIAGQNISYLITVRNNGSSNAQNVSVTDNLPAGLTFISANPSTGSFTGTEWQIGTLSSGASATLLLTALVNANVTEGTVINNTAIVSSPTSDPEPENNTSTSTKTVNSLADLVMNKTASNDNPNAGEQIVYTLSVENIGPSNAVNVNVNDVVPSTLTITGVSTNVGSWISPDWIIGSLPVGQTVQLTITANVKANVPNGTSINNTANVSSGTPDPVSSNNTSTHTANISTSSDLTITKTANKNEVVAGESLVYTITVTNNGPSNALDVLVTDNISSELTLTSADATLGNFIYPNWNIGTLTHGSSATLTLNTMVADVTPYGIEIVNSTIVTSPTPDPDPNNNTSTITVPVVTQADLAVIKTATPNPLVAGEDITYSITVINSGPSMAQNVSVTDLLPSELVFINESASIGTWSAPEWAIGNMPVNSSQTLTINASVKPEILQGTIIQNTATVDSDTDDPVSSNNTSIHNGNVAAIADLTLTKEAINEAIAGDTLIYQISVSNEGPSDAQFVQVSDPVPSIFETPEYSTDNGESWNDWTGILTYGLVNNGDFFNFLLRGALNEGIDENIEIENTATALSSTSDPETSNNSDTETISVTTQSDLSIVKTGPESIIAGTKISYSITVLNNGPSNATNLRIEDILPSEISNGEYSLNNGNSWQPWSGLRTLPDFLATPGINNLLVRGDVSPSATGALLNLATVSSDTPDTDLGNNESEVTTTIQSSANLILTKTNLTSPVYKNDEIVYLISVFNDGPSDATNTVISDIIDPLVISGAEFSSDGGTVWAAWTGSLNVGTIADNETYSLRIRGTVTNVAANPLLNTASVTSDVPDPNPGNNSQTVETPLEVEVDLSIIKTGPANIIAGTQITYAIEVENLSPNMNAQSVIVSDNIDEDFVVNPEYSIDGGSNWVAWSGSLNIGTLSFGEKYEIQIRADVLSNVTQNLNNTASVASNTPDPDNSNNASSIVTNIEREADIVVMKEMVTEAHRLIAGAEVVYRITYSNNGPSDATNYMVYDNVPDMITGVEASRCESGFLPWNGSVNMGTVVAGGICTVLIRGTLTSDYSGDIENIATVSSEVNDPILSNNTAQTNNEVYAVADLAVVKTSVSEAVIAGEVLTYTINVNNYGLSDAQNVVVTENLPAQLDLISATPSVGNWNSPEWNIGSLANGASATMEIQTRVRANVLQGSTISNTVLLTSSTPDSIPTNNSSTINNSVNALANLSVVKTANLSEVIAGENIIYTIVVNNQGPSDAQNVVLTDNLPTGLTFIEASPSVGSFAAQQWSVGSLSAGASETLTLTALVNSNIPTGSQIINTAIVSSSTSDPDTDNNTSTSTSNITASTDLSITKTAMPSPFIAGESITYTITVSNNGPSNAQNVSVTDNLPAELEFISATTSNGTWFSPEWTIGTIPAGSSRTLVIEARVLADIAQSSTIENTAIVTSSTPDPILDNNQSVHTGNVNALADLSINKTVLGSALAGNIIIYEINVTNSGPSNAQSVMLIDHIPSLISNTEYSSNGGNSWQLWPGTYTHGLLTTGNSFGILLRGELSESAEQSAILVNTASVESTTGDPVLSNNSDTESIIINRESDLSIEKSGPASIVAGTKITYSLTVLNNGPSNASNLRIEDALPAGVSNGEYSLNNGNSWQPWSGLRTLPEFLANPGVNNILIRGDVSPSATGTLVNTATVSSDTPDPDLDNNQSEATTQIESSANLILSKTALTSPVYKNETIVYQINVFNDGPGDAPNTVISDILNPTIISGAEYSTNNGLTWNNWAGNINIGTLANNANFSVQIRGTVSNSAPNPIENTASVSSDANDPEPENNTQTILTPLEVEADLQIVKTAPVNIYAGSQITFNIEVRNLSPSMTAESVIISDYIDNEYVTNPKYSINGGSVWTKWKGTHRIDSLKFGEVITIQIQGVVPSNRTGSITNSAGVSANTPDSDYSNNYSTVVTQILNQANIEVIKELYSSVDELKSGSEIVYRITYKNNGPSDAINFMMYDTVPNIITNVEASRCESGFIPWKGYANMGTVVAGGECTVLIKGIIGSDFSGNITNSVTVSSDVFDPVPENNTSSVTNNVVASADLKIEKWASETAVWIGNEFKYTLIVTNNGLSDAQNVVVTDVLPNELELINVETETGSWMSPNWNIGLLKNGSSVSLSLNVRVKNNAQQGNIIRNTAFVSSSTFDPVETNNTATRIIYINAGTDISVQKNVNKNVVEAGDTLTYTIEVSNNGPSDAYNVYVEDIVPQGLTIVNVNLSGGSWILPKWTIGNILAGETFSMQILTIVNALLPNGTVINNTATVYSSTTDTDTENNTSTVSTIVSSENEYHISKTASVNSVKIGDVFTYSIIVNNLGPSDVQNFSIIDQLPPQLQFIDATPEAQFSNGELLWNIDNFVVGSQVLLNANVSVKPNTPIGSIIRNVALGISEDGDSIKSNPSIVNIIPHAELIVSKSANANKVYAGDKIIYTINVQNNGNSSLNNIVIIDELQTGLTFLSASHNGTLLENIVEWNIPYLAVNSSLSVTLEVLTNNELPHQTVIYNTAIVRTDEINEPKQSNIEDVVIEGLYYLEINKTAFTDSVIPGDIFTYNIELLNNGPSVAQNISVVDQLPSELSFISTNNGGVFSNNIVQWQIDSLKAGYSINIIIEVRLNEGLSAGTNVRNIALAYKPDVNEPEVADTSTITVKNKTDDNKSLYISKHSNKQTASVGDTVEYSIQVVNTGSSTALNIQVSDILPLELTFVSATDGGTLNDNNLLSWFISSLEQNESKTMWLKAILNNNAFEGSSIENIAVAKGENRDSVIVDEPVIIEVVNSYQIVANNDYATIDYFFYGTAIANVLVNDSLNNKMATLSQVEISVIEPFNHQNIRLDINTGEIIINGTLPVGTYQLNYRICEIEQPSNCDDAFIIIHITDDCEMIIPDGFSPNNDGVGDYFRITCIDRYPDAKIEIFNRWGNMVYSQNQYGNINVWGDIDAWWDGRSKHKWNFSDDLLPVGTYFYILRLNQGAKPITGSIFLNR